MLAGIAMKKAIPVTAIAVVFVIAGCTFSSHNSYEFSANEAAADSAQIEKVFGITNQVAVTYKTGTEEESIAEQKQIVAFSRKQKRAQGLIPHMKTQCLSSTILKTRRINSIYQSGRQSSFSQCISSITMKSA